MLRLEQLAAGNWQPPSAMDQRIVGRLARLAGLWLEQGKSRQDLVSTLFVPGRVELLGKHTDYAGGRSLTLATAQGLCALVEPGSDPILRIEDRGRGLEMDLKLDRAPVGELKDWTLYPATLAMRLRAARDTSLVGGQMIFESDLPMAAGMSSSSVLLVSTFLALARCNDLDQDSGWQRQIPDRQVLAEFLGAVEGGRRFQILAGDQGVGTRGGDQDHTAILCSAPGSVRQYRYLPTMLEGTIPMPADWVLALAVSGVRAAKKKGAGTHYNRAAEAVRRLEQCWETDLGEAPATLGQIVGSDPQAAERLFECVGSTISEPRLRSRLQDRLRHFLAEAEEIVPAAGEALAAGDLELLGHWSDRSMTLATELLGNQVPETIWLAAAARERGAPAASAFGAGFGGAVWALVPSGDIDRFLQGWRSDYLRRFPQHRATARFDWTRAGMGAGEF